MFRFTIRDVLWLTMVVVILAWGRADGQLRGQTGGAFSCAGRIWAGYHP
jgi:hypothetical protein